MAVRKRKNEGVCACGAQTAPGDSATKKASVPAGWSRSLKHVRHFMRFCLECIKLMQERGAAYGHECPRCMLPYFCGNCTSGKPRYDGCTNPAFDFRQNLCAQCAEYCWCNKHQDKKGHD